MPQTLAALLSENGLTATLDVPMAQHTSLRVGGPAALWLAARSNADIALARALAAEVNIPCRVVGHGSNLLIRDGGLPGLTLHIGSQMAETAIDGNRLWAQAGARLTQLAQLAQTAGLAGLEGLSGIPGTLGGALCMNAGAYGTEIGQLVESVEILDADGHTRTVSPAEMAFGYRASALAGHAWIATAATLRLAPDAPDAIAARMQAYAQARREKQPVTLPSAGSFFKRPAEQYAAALIDAAGLKGLSVGGAQVSTLHAGFFVNTGGATAADFLTLMQCVQARVYEASGIMLEPEVRILGCDSSC